MIHKLQRHPVMSKPKGWLELGFVFYLQLNKGKRFKLLDREIDTFTDGNVFYKREIWVFGRFPTSAFASKEFIWGRFIKFIKEADLEVAYSTTLQSVSQAKLIRLPCFLKPWEIVDP